MFVRLSARQVSLHVFSRMLRWPFVVQRATVASLWLRANASKCSLYMSYYYPCLSTGIVVPLIIKGLPSSNNAEWAPTCPRPGTHWVNRAPCQDRHITFALSKTVNRCPCRVIGHVPHLGYVTNGNTIDWLVDVTDQIFHMPLEIGDFYVHQWFGRYTNRLKFTCSHRFGTYVNHRESTGKLADQVGPSA